MKYFNGNTCSMVLKTCSPDNHSLRELDLLKNKWITCQSWQQDICILWHVKMSEAKPCLPYATMRVHWYPQAKSRLGLLDNKNKCRYPNQKPFRQNQLQSNPNESVQHGIKEQAACQWSKVEAPDHNCIQSSCRVVIVHTDCIDQIETRITKKIKFKKICWEENHRCTAKPAAKLKFKLKSKSRLVPVTAG